MFRTVLAVVASTVALAACGDNGRAEAPVPGSAVSTAEVSANRAIDTHANPAIAPEETTETASLTPAPDAFTEGQAREAIEKQGYAVSGALTLDGQGIWKGQASKSGGAATTVSVDHKGVVTPG